MRDYPSAVNLDLREYSTEFEKLALKLLEHQFRVKPDLAFVTRPVADGGYDGVLQHTLMAAEDVHFISVLEAKLRSEPKIKLDVVGKAVIIAFNRAASALFIVTNRDFYPQTLTHLRAFQAKTNLRIVMVNGSTLSAWIVAARPSLTDIAPALLDYLLVTAPPATTKETRTVEAERETKVAANVFTLPPAEEYELELGWSDGHVARCELRPSGRQAERSPPPPLLGTARPQMVRELTSALQRRVGIGMITGGAGVGKSVVVQNLREHLASRGVVSSVISMTGVTSRRLYFLRLLSAIIGVDVETIAVAEGKAGIDAILRQTGSEATPDDQRKVVAAILSGDMSDFDDVALSVTNRYLSALASTHVEPRQVLFFQNLEESVREVLLLLGGTARSLVTGGISTIFEVRRFGEAGTASATESLTGLLSAEEWGVVVRSLEEAITYRSYEVAPLSEPEAIQYVETLLPGFGHERLAAIVKNVGTNPLLLRSAVAWLQDSGVLRGESDAAVIADIERFFLGVEPGDASVVLERHLQLWWREFNDVFAIASLTDGRVTRDALAVLRSGNTAPDRVAASGEVAGRLVATRIFEPVPGNASEYRLVHALMHSQLRRIFDSGVPSRDFAAAPIVLHDAARRMVPHLSTLFGESELPLRRPFFFGAAGQWDEAFAAARAGVEQAETSASWADVTRLDDLAIRALEFRDLPPDERMRWRIELTVELLRAERQRERLALDANVHHVQSLAAALRIAPEPASPAQRRRMVDGFLLEARHHYTREEYVDAHEAAQRAAERAWGWHEDVGEQRCAKAFVELGLTLKGLDRREDSFTAFDDACGRLPANEFLKNERRSNLASALLASDPAAARRFYEEILATGAAGDEDEHLHAQIDIAMSDFLLRDYPLAEKEARDALVIAVHTKHYAQIARARNIIGCCEWATGRIREANSSFEAATIAAERTLLKRYLWRMRVNRAGTALLVDDARCVNIAWTAAEMILTPRRWAIEEFDRHSEYRKSRWYVALVALGTVFHALGKAEYRTYLDFAAIPVLDEDVRSAVSREFSTPAFIGTTHVHAGQIMITG